MPAEKPLAADRQRPVRHCALVLQGEPVARWSATGGVEGLLPSLGVGLGFEGEGGLLGVSLPGWQSGIGGLEHTARQSVPMR